MEVGAYNVFGHFHLKDMAGVEASNFRLRDMVAVEALVLCAVFARVAALVLYVACAEVMKGVLGMNKGAMVVSQIVGLRHVLLR